jgi:rhamnosyltransferase
MPTNEICAVVVTYHPQPRDFENLRILREQVDDLVVVDNGSSADVRDRLQSASRDLNFALIEHGENLGIGAGLNTGVKWAERRGSKWVALFDQDSRVTDGFIAQMLADFHESAIPRAVLLIIPGYRDPHTAVERVCALDSDGGPFVTITSGSMLPIVAFQRLGYFREDLFIYTVDDEFSLRLRSMGYSIALSSRAILLHKSGSPTYTQMWGIRFSTTNYKAAVRYYVSRNRVWMIRHYGSAYPRWARGAVRASIVDICKLLIAEKSKLDKLGMIAYGVWHGVRGRLGRTVAI